MSVNLDLGDTRLILAECAAAGLLRNQAAYVCGTSFWETARTMKPVREAFWLSEAWRKKNLRYYPHYGRGYVQLTWLRNFVFAGEKLGVDLVTDPDVVMQPAIAAKILVRGSLEGWFTGKKLSDYITLAKSDFVGARRIINGTDRAATIAAIARDYDKALTADGYGATVKAPLTAGEFVKLCRGRLDLPDDLEADLARVPT